MFFVETSMKVVDTQKLHKTCFFYAVVTEIRIVIPFLNEVYPVDFFNSKNKNEDLE